MTSDSDQEREDRDMYETATQLQRRSELLRQLRRMMRDAAVMNGHGVPEVTVAAGLCADAEDVLLSLQPLGYTVIVAFVAGEDAGTGLTRVLLEPGSSEHD